MLEVSACLLAYGTLRRLELLWGGCFDVSSGAGSLGSSFVEFGVVDRPNGAFHILLDSRKAFVQ